jgi:transposase
MPALDDPRRNRIGDLLPGRQGDPGRAGAGSRRFAEAVVWTGRNGARWRAPPAEYGDWNSVHRRSRR